MLGERAFTIGCRDYLWLDVLLAAMARGDWAPFEAGLREGLACAAHAAETGAEAGEAADDLLAEFRYARNLITAVEAEAWMERVGLTAEDLGAWCERRVFRARWAGELSFIIAAHPPSADELAEALPAEGICSGAFQRFEMALAGRAAVADSESSSSPADKSPEQYVGQGFSPADKSPEQYVGQGFSPADKSPEQHVGQGFSPADTPPAQYVGQGFSPADILSTHAWALDGHSPSDCAARLAHLATVNHAFEAITTRELTETALEAKVAANRLEWMRVVLERLVFPQESMAREAVLCCRDDNLTLGELSAEINRRLERQEVLLAACPPDVQAAVLSAPTGQVAGPVPVGDTYHVLVVRQKQVPTLADPDVRSLATRAVVDALVDRECTARVRWGKRF